MTRRHAVLGGTLAAAILAMPAAPPAHASHTSEREMLRAINDYRARHDRPPLRRSRTLSRSSRRYAGRLLRLGKLRHMGIHPSSVYWRVGENLAWHRGRRPLVSWTLSQWKASPAHRRVLLGRSYRRAGARPVAGRFGGAPATVWVLHVGAPR